MLFWYCYFDILLSCAISALPFYYFDKLVSKNLRNYVKKKFPLKKKSRSFKVAQWWKTKYRTSRAKFCATLNESDIFWARHFWRLSKQKRKKFKIEIFTAIFLIQKVFTYTVFFRFPNHILKLKALGKPQSAGEESLLTRDNT